MLEPADLGTLDRPFQDLKIGGMAQKLQSS